MGDTFRRLIATGIDLDAQDVFGDTISHWLIKQDGKGKDDAAETKEDPLEDYHGGDDDDNEQKLELEYDDSNSLYFNLLEVIIVSAKKKPNLSHIYNLSKYSAIMDVIDKYSQNEAKFIIYYKIIII